jgi:hypothetical protein
MAEIGQWLVQEDRQRTAGQRRDRVPDQPILLALVQIEAERQCIQSEQGPAGDFQRPDVRTDDAPVARQTLGIDRLPARDIEMIADIMVAGKDMAFETKPCMGRPRLDKVGVVIRAIEGKIAGVDDDVRRSVAQVAGYEVEVAAEERLFGGKVAVGNLGNARDHVSVRLEAIRRPAAGRLRRA